MKVIWILSATGRNSASSTMTFRGQAAVIQIVREGSVGTHPWNRT